MFLSDFASFITASVNENSVIYYSSDNQEWMLYSEKLSIISDGTYYFKAVDFANNVSFKSVTVNTVKEPDIFNMYCTSDNISWESEAARFNFSLTDGSGNIMSLAVNGNHLDFYGLLYGEYAAKVKSFNGSAWSETIGISSNW